MKLPIAYGERGLTLELPDANVTVVEPRYAPGLPDQTAAVRDALRAPIAAPPLRELVRPTDRVVIVFSDLTRPVPNRTIFPPLLAELDHLPAEQITLLNGTGLHRPNSPDELEWMLGPAVVRRYRVVNHDAHDPAGLVFLGTTVFGGEIWLNRNYVDADVRIVTGFIEPHFFAGFSGGPKGVIPGVAGARTVLHNHNAAMIGHPQARWGVTRGNPIHEEQRAGVALAPPHFLLNVATNREKQITAVFAGDYLAAHARGCDFVARAALVPVPQRFPIVVTTNSGYPLDLNLYQAVKGMAAAEEIVAPGGAIVMAAECREGIGHGDFGHLLAEGAGPAEILAQIAAPGFARLDQWQVQILARILRDHRVYLYSDRLPPEEIRRAHVIPVPSVEAALADLRAEFGPAAPICVLPQGPLTIPTLDGWPGTPPDVRRASVETRSGPGAGEAFLADRPAERD
jgi:nickel-dependent lactate racemase